MGTIDSSGEVNRAETPLPAGRRVFLPLFREAAPTLRRQGVPASIQELLRRNETSLPANHLELSGPAGAFERLFWDQDPAAAVSLALKFATAGANAAEQKDHRLLAASSVAELYFSMYPDVPVHQAVTHHAIRRMVAEHQASGPVSQRLRALSTTAANLIPDNLVNRLQYADKAEKAGSPERLKLALLLNIALQPHLPAKRWQLKSS